MHRLAITAAAVLLSTVSFAHGHVVPDLGALQAACDARATPLFLDAYHHLNVVPFSVRLSGLDNAFITGGGYKYCQLGEGNCFLRVPPGCELRPVITGWFSEFAELADAPSSVVGYGRGAARFAGATYDPTSHYRAAAVFAFHQRMTMTATRLRSANVHQVGMLARRFEALDLDPALGEIIPMPAARRGGFLAIRCADATNAVLRLRARNLFADARGDILRLGPAPYISDQQLLEAGEILRQVFKR